MRRITIGPLASTAQALPLGEAAGVLLPLEHRPGILRPFVATLAVPMPMSGKHNTTSTRPRTAIATHQSSDGKVVPDTSGDVGSDS